MRPGAPSSGGRAMASQAASARSSRRGMSALRRREEIEGYLWITPWILGFTIFVAGPMIASFYLSFNSYAIVSPPKFIGIKNYVQIFTVDKLFWGSLGRTAYYAFVNVPVGMTLSLLAAVLLNQHLKFTVLFRTLFFLPSLTPIVASALLWQWLLHPEVGLVNFTLWQFRIQGPGWLGDPDWAIPSLILIALWMGVGGNRMIIFLAGLQSAPQELYDAAEVDGAGLWQRFWNITIPLLTPTIFFNLVLGIIGSFSVFAMAFVTTSGGPNYATYFYNLHLYNQAFQYFEMGYASALAWIFFVVMLTFTYIQFRLSSRWVYYEGEVKA
jgi:multiple sugar transport system permease protein